MEESLIVIDLLKFLPHQNCRGDNMLYDIEILLENLDLTNKEKEDLISELRNEFPQDDMLFELHLFRAVQFLKNKKSKNKSL